MNQQPIHTCTPCQLYGHLFDEEGFCAACGENNREDEEEKGQDEETKELSDKIKLFLLRTE